MRHFVAPIGLLALATLFAAPAQSRDGQFVQHSAFSGPLRVDMDDEIVVLVARIGRADDLVRVAFLDERGRNIAEHDLGVAPSETEAVRLVVEPVRGVLPTSIRVVIDGACPEIPDPNQYRGLSEIVASVQAQSQASGQITTLQLPPLCAGPYAALRGHWPKDSGPPV